MKLFTQKTIDVVQWIFIIGLVTMLILLTFKYRQAKSDLISNAEYNKENTYIRIYESQKLNKLKKENKELYDSISKLKHAESGMVIKFVEHYNTDTIHVDKFLLKTDTFYVNNALQIDSIYKYKKETDTVNLSIDIKAKDLKWVNADVKIKDKFMIINSEKDGINQTVINHSSNATIEGTTMWHKKNNKKWYQKFSVGPQIGVGYGFINKKVDVYAGVGISYDF